MALILYKWFLLAATSMLMPGTGLHPVYVSVTEIEHNAKARSMEVSCKIFTDDFEKALRATTSIKVDLLNPASRPAMDKLINGYVQQHLKIKADGKPVTLKYLGYEQAEEAVISYYEAEGIPEVKSISVQDNILYEYQSEQISLLHITVNGNRKSTRLSNPDDKVTIQF